MIQFDIPSNPEEIPFTQNSNPLEIAKIYYKTGYVWLVPLCYLQAAVKAIVKVITAPFVMLHRKIIAKRIAKRMQNLRMYKHMNPELYAAGIGESGTRKVVNFIRPGIRS